MWGSLKSALHLEKVRLERMDKSLFSIDNDVFNAWAMTVVLFGALTAIFGLEVLPWLLLQAVVGFSLLEAVNYLEHYGLLRQKRDDGSGRYELLPPRALLEQRQRGEQRLPLPPAAPLRSTPTRCAATRHWSLRGPAGAALGVRHDDPVRLRPPVWRRVMDPKVLAHYDGDVTRANILRASASGYWPSTEEAA